MQTQTLHYSRPIISTIFKGVSHEDLKWTINYLMTLLEIPENEVDDINIAQESKPKLVQETCTKRYSARINKLLSIPKREISDTEINDDIRLQSILER